MNHPKIWRLLCAIAIACGAANSSSGKTIRVPGDAASIQAAIDRSQAGDEILVAAGTYFERIVLRANITLKSEGDDAKGHLGLARAEATIIDGTIQEDGTGDSADTLPGVTMAESALLDGFTITGIGTYDEAKWNQHHATQGNDQSHEHIGALGNPGIQVEGTECTVRNNIVHHIGYTGIAIQATADRTCAPLVERNVCYRNMGGGIGSMRGSTATIRDNVCFENFYAGIGNHNASPLIVGNECFENIRAGIGVSEGSCPIVKDNECYRNLRAGIGVRTGATTRPVIRQNECYENRMAGIGVEDFASPTISNNRCFRNRLAGIGCRNHAQVTMVENECFENGTVGIGNESGAKTTLLRNDCHGNQAAGIGFSTCEQGTSTLVGNRVVDNAKVAIGIHSGWQVTAMENEFARQGGMPPIVMVFAGANATFVRNRIRGEGVAGIRVAGALTAKQNTITCTKPREGGPPSIGIWTLPGSSVALSENQITGWRLDHSK